MQSLYELLGDSKTVIQREKRLEELNKQYGEDLVTTLKENAYVDFIKDKEKGLFRILKTSILNLNAKLNAFEVYYLKWDNLEFIEEFCRKYDFNLISTHGSTKTSIYIDNIKNIEDIKRLINCFYCELQQIEYYSKSKEELWNENNIFIEENKTWIDSKKSLMVK